MLCLCINKLNETSTVNNANGRSNNNNDDDDGYEENKAKRKKNNYDRSRKNDVKIHTESQQSNGEHQATWIYNVVSSPCHSSL